MKTNLLRSLQLVGIVGITITATVATAAGPAFTTRSAIVVLDSGWGADTVSIKLLTDSVANIYTNPAGCAAPQAGYVTSTNDPGRKLYQDQLQEAFWRNYPVRLLISGTPGDCPFGKPRIISVSMCRPSTLGPC
jgi:hypothetical protein